MENTLFASRRFTYTSYLYYYCEATNDHRSSYSIWIKIDVKGTVLLTFKHLELTLPYTFARFQYVENLNDKFQFHKTQILLYIMQNLSNGSNMGQYYRNVPLTLTFILDGPENVTVTSPQAPVENSQFSLHCSANCLHGCDSYRWSNGSRRLNKSMVILTIDNLSRADNGKYTCSVEDYFGQSSSTYNLKVQCK